MTDKKQSGSARKKHDKPRKVTSRPLALATSAVVAPAPKPVTCRLVNRKNTLTTATILTAGGVIELRLGPHASSEELELGQLTPHTRRLIAAGFLTETTA